MHESFILMVAIQLVSPTFRQRGKLTTVGNRPRERAGGSLVYCRKHVTLVGERQDRHASPIIVGTTVGFVSGIELVVLV